MRQIPFLDLSRQHRELEPEITEAVARCFSEGRFVLGENVDLFESEWAGYCGVSGCATMNSGTDALALALLASDAVTPNGDDEVITPAVTAGYTPLAILEAGAIPVFADVNPGSLLIDPASIEAQITSKTKAIIPVHLYGQLCEMKPIFELARKHGLIVIEDAAQAHGAWRSGPPGNTSAAATFSFYPTKNLGAYGDGGAVVSNDLQLIENIKMLRQGGHPAALSQRLAGKNSRLDEIQAGILRIKLRKLDLWNARRNQFAEMYHEAIGRSHIVKPLERAGTPHANHLFVVRSDYRDPLRSFLEQKGILTMVHYPTPLHLERLFTSTRRSVVHLPVAESVCKEILSLPMNPHSLEWEIHAICKAVEEFNEESDRIPTAYAPHI